MHLISPLKTLISEILSLQFVWGGGRGRERERQRQGERKKERDSCFAAVAKTQRQYSNSLWVFSIDV